MTDPELANSVQEMTAIVDRLKGALEVAAQRMSSLMVPIGDALQKWMETKTPGANADDDALIAAIGELHQRVELMGQDIARDIAEWQTETESRSKGIP